LVQSHHVLEQAVRWALSKTNEDRNDMFKLLVSNFTKNAVALEVCGRFNQLNQNSGAPRNNASLAEQFRKAE